jgi:hypothetical protein
MNAETMDSRGLRSVKTRRSRAHPCPLPKRNLYQLLPIHPAAGSRLTWRGVPGVERSACQGYVAD